MIKLFLLTLSLFVLLQPFAYSNSDERRSKEEIQTILSNVKEKCMSEHKAYPNACSKSDNSESMYDSKLFGFRAVNFDFRFASHDPKKQLQFYESTETKIREKTHILAHKLFLHLFNSSYKTARKEYNKLVHDMIIYAKKNSLNKEQRLALVHCISASLITYSKQSESVDSLVDGKTTDIISKGYGMCRQFTTLAYDLAKRLNLSVARGHGDGHAYLIVKINNRWYTTEPQHEACELMPLKTSSIKNAIMSRMPILINKIPYPVILK